MKYYFIITTQHTGRTGTQIVATQSGTIDVTPGETEGDIYRRVTRHEEERVGMDRTAYSVLFYRAVPNERTRDRG